MIIKPGFKGLFYLKDSNIEPHVICYYDKVYAMHYSIFFDIGIILNSFQQF